jgi:hypothetical protein
MKYIISGAIGLFKKKIALKCICYLSMAAFLTRRRYSMYENKARPKIDPDIINMFINQTDSNSHNFIYIYIEREREYVPMTARIMSHGVGDT